MSPQMYSLISAREDAAKAAKDYPRTKAIAYCVRMSRLMKRMDRELASQEYAQRAFALLQEN